MSIFKFEKDSSTKAIEIAELKQSLMIRDAKGNTPKNRPCQSWELIEMVHEEALKHGLDAKVSHIYVAQSGSNPVINREEKELYKSGDNIPVNKWLFGRVAFMITIAHSMDHDTTTAIVGTFHDKGLQIAFGQHVSVCSNMCIFGSNLMQTYGPTSMPFDKIEEMITKWLQEFEEKRTADLAIINEMKEYFIQEDELQGLLDSMVGNMFRKAVRKNYFAGDDFVFNMTQCGDFVKQFETALIPVNGDESKEPLSLWDLYNFGTEILSPAHTEISAVYTTNQSWGTFLHNFIAWDTKAKPIPIEEAIPIPIAPAKKGRK